MKQQITQQDHNSLSYTSKSKLAEWMEEHKDDFIWPWGKNDEGNWRMGKMPLLTIDQMIEFLRHEMFSIEAKRSGWNVRYMSHDYSSNELCDALWEAVKEKLNE